jgi:hypothetical protein
MQINAFKLDIPVSDTPEAPDLHGTDVASDARRSRSITALAAVLWLEAVAIAAATIYLGVEILTAPASSLPSAIALAAVAAIAAVWVAVIAIHVVRGNAWVRGASIVLQVLIIAIAVGSFQGKGAVPGIGVALLVPAIVVLILVFSKDVVAHTSRRGR